MRSNQKTGCDRAFKPLPNTILLDNAYEGENKKSGYVKHIAVTIIVLLALTVTVMVVFDVPFLEEPLHEFLSTFVPPDAFVWQFIKTAPILTVPDLPEAPDGVLQEVVETVVDTSRDTTESTGVTTIIDEIGNPLVPLGTIVDNKEETPEISLEPNDAATELPADDDINIPVFEDELDRTLSDDTRLSLLGEASIGDSFTGVVIGVNSGNSLDVGERLLVLVGVDPNDGAVQYLEEICPVGVNVVYDVDDHKSLSKDGGLYAKVWCYVPGLPNQSANQLMLESGHARIDYSCIGSEFASDYWVLSSGCPT